MSRSRLLFIFIIGIALLVVAGTQIAQRLPTQPTPTPLPAEVIEIAVNPMAFSWVQSQADLFNQENQSINGTPIRIVLSEIDGISLWGNNGATWSLVKHPTAWIPESTFALNYATGGVMQFRIIASSIASTPLIWGVFSERAEALGQVSWTTIHDATVKGTWDKLSAKQFGNVNLAFPYPPTSTIGFSVLLSGAAAYKQNPDLTGNADFTEGLQKWLAPIIDAVPSFGTLGLRPASALATRGQSVADIALLPESEWLLNYKQINDKSSIKFYYPEYAINFDMPFVVWQGSPISNAQQLGAERFAKQLTDAAAQKQSSMYGLRPATIPMEQSNLTLFTNATTAGISIDSPQTSAIQMPKRDNALGLLDWLRVVRSS